MLTAKLGEPPSYAIVPSATQRSPPPPDLSDLEGRGGGVRASPLAEALDSDEALARLRELEDGVVVVHLVRAVGIAARVLEVLQQHRLHGRLVHGAESARSAPLGAQGARVRPAALTPGGAVRSLILVACAR